jgi:hypothetical protein
VDGHGAPWGWNAREQEWTAAYPCDEHVSIPHRGMVRAIDVQAPADVVYRWVCQLKVAPYSYDWIDNFGRRSPRHLTAGLDRLEVGQRFMIGPIVAFEPNRHVTVVIDEHNARAWGQCSLTYLVKPNGPASARLVVKLDLPGTRWWERARNYLLAWGDLVMMRKQLLTLRDLAGRTVVEESAVTP